MKNRLALILCFMLTAFTLAAQPDSVSSDNHAKIRYSNSFQAGALLGKKGNGSYTTLTTIHGIRYNRLGIGLGTGYEGYTEWRTLPLFAAVSYDFVKVKDNAFFVQFNGGYSLAYRTAEYEDNRDYDVDGGQTFAGILGYRIKTNKLSISFSSGYKFQRIKYSYTPSLWWGGDVAAPVTSVERDMERFVVQIGVGIN